MDHSDERKIIPPDLDDDIKIIEENERAPETKARSTPIQPIVSDNDIIILGDIPDTSSSIGYSEKYPDGLPSSEKIRERRQPSISIRIKNVKNTENTNFLIPDLTGESESERKSVEIKVSNEKNLKSKNIEAKDENAIKSLVSYKRIPQTIPTVPYTDNKKEAGLSDIPNVETIIKDTKSKSGQNSPEIKATDNKIPGITNKDSPADGSIKTPVTSDRIPQTTTTAPFADNIEDTHISVTPIENYTESISPQKIPESQLNTVSSGLSSSGINEGTIENLSADTSSDLPNIEILPTKTRISEKIISFVICSGISYVLLLTPLNFLKNFFSQFPNLPGLEIVAGIWSFLNEFFPDLYNHMFSGNFHSPISAINTAHSLIRLIFHFIIPILMIIVSILAIISLIVTISVLMDIIRGK